MDNMNMIKNLHQKIMARNAELMQLANNENDIVEKIRICHIAEGLLEADAFIINELIKE